MAGHSTVQSMIIVLRNNQNLLRKSNPFRRKTYFENREAFEKHCDEVIELKRASPEQIREIRRNIIIHRRTNIIRKLIVTLVILGCIGWLGMIIYDLNLALAPNHNTKLSDKETEENYQFYLKDGHNWLRNRNYQNAVSQYRKAKQIHSDSFSVNFGLAQALSYQCEYEKTGCKESLHLLDSLVLIYPHKLKLYGLKTQCYISLNDSVSLNKNYQILKKIKIWN